MLNDNQKAVQEIQNRYYFQSIKAEFEKLVEKVGEVEALDYLTEVMQNSKKSVEKVILERMKKGKIKDPDQTRKSVAGNGFQGLIAYSLIKLQEKGLLHENLIITLKPKRHLLIDKYVSITVGNETQRPDIDLLLYSSENTEKYPIMIYSIKTSFRERAGQTYRWKLLMDIAASSNCHSIKEKYGLEYKGENNFMIGMITTNFYNEIMAPQQQGMLKFFDFVYITKPGEWKKPVMKLSQIVKDLNSIYSGKI